MGAGRPPIGHKEQTTVPPEVSIWITEEQKRKNARDRAEIVRLLVMAGYQAVRNQA